MSNRIWTTILAIALIGSFFLPYIKAGNVDISGYDYVFKSMAHKNKWEKYIWLIIPVAGMLLLVGAMNNENYILGRSLLAWLPLMTVIFVIVRVYMNADAVGNTISLKQLIKLFGTGFWIATASAVLLAFVNPRRR